MDLEMTGLEPEENTIIEIATIVTEGDLTVVAEEPAFAISQPESELSKMDNWYLTHHTENVLLDRVRNHGIPMAEAEMIKIKFLRAHRTGGGREPDKDG